MNKLDSDPEPRKYTLLIVDDEEGPRQSLVAIFKDEYSLLLAETGAKAIELAQQYRVDAVLSDIRMGGMTGIELLEKLKEVDPGIQVIMITAYETIETARQAVRLGACDYLDKLSSVEIRRAAVAKAMEKRTVSDEMQLNIVKLHELQTQLQSQEISASIIHDINGPLTIISGFIQLINARIADASRVEGEDLEMVKDRLKKMTRQVTNCIDISKRYLSLMRPHSPNFCEVRVNQVLTDLEELLRAQPSSHAHELIVKTLPKDVTLQINGIDLIQILLNLSINGLQSSDEPHCVRVIGQIISDGSAISKIKASSADAVLNRDGFKALGPVLLLSVQDTGPGIPPELISKIFEPYFSTKPAGKGTGLGLSIVQRLLKEANGLLHLHSVVGQGTTFNLYFPTHTVHEQ